mgnify:CR=1 FL=1
MRLNAKELIAEARKIVTAPTLPPAAAKLMTTIADRLDVQFAALCESRNEVKQLAGENAVMKSAIKTHSESVHFCVGCGKDDPCSNDDVCYALEETPVTDAFLASLRAEAITDALENSSDYLDTDCVMDRHDISYQDAELRAAGAMEMHDSLVAVANHLRNKAG